MSLKPSLSPEAAQRIAVLQRRAHGILRRQRVRPVDSAYEGVPSRQTYVLDGASFQRALPTPALTWRPASQGDLAHLSENVADGARVRSDQYNERHENEVFRGALLGARYGAKCAWLFGVVPGFAVGLGVSLVRSVVLMLIEACRARPLSKAVRDLERASKLLDQADTAWFSAADAQDPKSARALYRASVQASEWRPLPRSRRCADGIDEGEVEGIEARAEATVNGTMGVAQMQGNRAHMEDRFCNTTLDHPRLRETRLIGVFDGHSGSRAVDAAPEIVRSVLTERLTQLSDAALEDPVQVRACIKDAFYSTNPKVVGEQIQRALRREIGLRGGTTAVLALSLRGSLYIINIGDSRAIFVDPQGTPMRLSCDQKPGEHRERRKLNRRLLSNRHGVPRVDGFAVARALGDPLYDLGRRPQVTRVRLPERGHLLLGSDGIFDDVSDAEVARTLHLAKGPDGQLDIADAAKRVVARAYRMGDGGADNLTALVVPVA